MNTSIPPATAKRGTTVDQYYAQTLQAIDQLTNVFSFPRDLAQKAIEECGPEDVQTCYNWILDNHPVQDHGGPVVPKTDCPHVPHCVQPNILNNISYEDIVSTPCQHFGMMRRRVSRKRLRDKDESATGNLKCDEDYETSNAKMEESKCNSCPQGENWLCLACGALLCSRYAKGHAKMHWEDTKSEDHLDEATGKPGVNYNSILHSGHCVAVSLGDLSVWCYECRAYLMDHNLDSITKKLEKMKFGTSPDHDDTKNQNNEVDHKGEKNTTKAHDESLNLDDIPVKVNKRKKQPIKRNPDKADTPEFSFLRTGNSDLRDQTNNGNKTHDSEKEEMEPDHQAFLLASLLHSENDETIRAYLSRHSSIDPGNMGQCVPMHMPAPPSFPDEMAEFLLSPLCKSVIVLAGAGMSVSSGIPDFRSAGVGLYDSLQPDLLTASQLERELIAEDPTLALDKGMFLRNPLPMLELKRDFILGTQESRWKATIAHRFVELLHTKGKLTRLYTQNIDGLELQCQNLPKDKVVNVHGSMGRAACEWCESEVDFDEFCSKIRTSVKDITGQSYNSPTESNPIVCEACGRPTVKPTIVLFRGSMPKEFHDRAAEDLGSCDLLIIMGTSLTVSPANSLVYRIPPTCLRLVINNEKVGRMLGIDYSEHSIRDVFAHGHSDEMCLDLIDKLGWLDDLAPVMNDLPESNANMLRARLEQRDK